MKVLITNVYSYKNKGDAAIVLSLFQEIKRMWPEAQVVIQTTDTRHDRGVYGTPVTSSLLWILLSSVRNRFIAVRVANLITGLIRLVTFLSLSRLLRVNPYFLLTKDLQQFVRDNQRAQLVIGCGGGYLRTASRSLRDTILLSITCLNFLTARYLGKNVYLYSQSIGPVHGATQRAILRFALNRTALIEVRENISYDLVRKLHIKTKVVMTADPALLLAAYGTFPAFVKLKSGRMHVGITVRKWFKNERDLNRYIGTIAKIIDYLVTQHKAQVFYVPQVIAENFDDDDRLIAKRVFSKVSNKESFIIVDHDLHPYEIIGLCGKMNFFIGTRMHSNIFALINHVPVVAIEYEHKTKGIMARLGIEDATIDIRKLNFEILRRKVEYVLNRKNFYRNLIRRNMRKQIELSKAAIQIIKQEADASYGDSRAR